MQISKALAGILRHSATSLGLFVREDGYCRAAEVLDSPPLRRLGASLEETLQAVRNNEKRRFEMREEAGEWLIRAVQGHSMRAVEDDSLLTRLSPHDRNLPTVCVHGTYRRHLSSILQNGLLPGGGASDRKHVHFAPFEPGDGRVISGMRSNCEIAIYLDLRAAILAGVPFFLSANQVILSPGLGGAVPKEFISRVRDLQSN